MSSTYSTLRHCKAMSLQMRIEEGRRSKALRVSGLRYCQYSQEKIRLITLLLDLVCLLLLSVEQIKHEHEHPYLKIVDVKICPHVVWTPAFI